MAEVSAKLLKFDRWKMKEKMPSRFLGGSEDCVGFEGPVGRGTLHLRRWEKVPRITLLAQPLLPFHCTRNKRQVLPRGLGSACNLFLLLLWLHPSPCSVTVLLPHGLAFWDIPGSFSSNPLLSRGLCPCFFSWVWTSSPWILTWPRSIRSELSSHLLTTAFPTCQSEAACVPSLQGHPVSACLLFTSSNRSKIRPRYLLSKDSRNESLTWQDRWLFKSNCFGWEKKKR